MQNRKRKRSQESLSADTITTDTHSPLKKRKITHYSQEDKENTPQSSNTNNNNSNDIDIVNDIDQPTFLSDIDNDDIFDSGIFDDSNPLSTPHSSNHNENENEATTDYSDGVWSILVPTNETSLSVLIKCDTFRIGRDESNDLQLSHMCISAAHCCITNNKIRDKILIVDDSKNGTYISNKKLNKNKEYILKNGNLISFAKGLNQFKYYFFLLKYFANNCNNNNKNRELEFNVRLNKKNQKYYLKINKNEWIYDEKIYNKERLAKCINALEKVKMDIPLSIGQLIVEYYGFSIHNIIAYQISKQRPIERNDKPVLIRSNTMCGSPIHGLTQECFSQHNE